MTSTNFLLASDPAAFAASQLLLRPDPAQAQVLRCRSPRVILNCSRQWGKSTVTAARALFHALSASGALILVASPSFRQSAEFIRKVSGFLRTLHLKPRGGGIHHYGSQRGRVQLAGRNVQVKRPRLRRKTAGEARIPAYEALR